MKLDLRVQQGDKLNTGMQVATMDEGEAQQSTLTMPFPGRVIRLLDGATKQPEEDVN